MVPERLEEPDVTPLVNVNFVILVMVLAIASHAAKLLPLTMPKAEKTEFVEMDQAVRLKVAEDDTYEFGGQAGLSVEELIDAMEMLDDDQIVLITTDVKAKYASLVPVLDYIMTREYLQVAFGQVEGARPPAPTTATAPAGD